MWKQYKHPTIKNWQEYRTDILTPSLRAGMVKVWLSSAGWVSVILTANGKRVAVDITGATSAINAQTKATAAVMRLGCTIKKGRK